MINNCRVTEYNANAQDENLPTFNAGIVEFKELAATIRLDIQGGKYKVLSGTPYTSAAHTEQLPTEGDATSLVRMYFLAGDTPKVQFEKYNVKQLSSGSSVKTVFHLDVLNYSPEIVSFGLNGDNNTRNDVEGTLEDFVEHQCEFRENGDEITFSWSYTKITLHGSYHKSSYIPTTIAFNSNGAVLSSSSFGTMATYNKTTKEWTYEEGV